PGGSERDLRNRNANAGQAVEPLEGEFWAVRAHPPTARIHPRDQVLRRPSGRSEIRPSRGRIVAYPKSPSPLRTSSNAVAPVFQRSHTGSRTTPQRIGNVSRADCHRRAYSASGFVTRLARHWLAPFTGAKSPSRSRTHGNSAVSKRRNPVVDAQVKNGSHPCSGSE